MIGSETSSYSELSGSAYYALSSQQLDLAKSAYCFTSFSDSEEDEGEITDDSNKSYEWNTILRKAEDMPYQLPSEAKERWKSIANVYQSFEAAAETFGKVIISEAFLDYKSKTIKPLENIGGLAGGEKYIHRGMLFKFAIDWKGIYGGDEYAMKAASHDLNGILHLYVTAPISVKLPLTAIVDYLGFRLIALALIPISSNTIVYGSYDAGKTIYDSNTTFNQMMVKVGDKMNIQSHVCGIDPDKTATLSLVCDIEGHLGKDDRFYLIDTARIFPPTKPNREHPQSVLYQLFRGEFVRNYSKKLNPDAFLPFSKHEPNIYLAYLYNECVLGSIRMTCLIEMVARAIKNFLLKSFRHKLKISGSFATQNYKEATTDFLNSLLGLYENESVNQCENKLKGSFLWNQLHEWLMKHFEEFPTPTTLSKINIEDLSGIALCNGKCSYVASGKAFHTLFSYNCSTCGIFGEDAICYTCAKNCHQGHLLSQPYLYRSYNSYCHCKNCKSRGSWILPIIDKINPLMKTMRPLLYQVIVRLGELTGLSYSKSSLYELRNYPDKTIFHSVDITQISSNLKKTHLAIFAEASYIQMQSSSEESPFSLRLSKEAVKLFRKAHNVFPGGLDIVAEYYHSLMMLCELTAERPDTFTKYTIQDSKYLERAIEICFTHKLLSKFLMNILEIYNLNDTIVQKITKHILPSATPEELTKIFEVVGLQIKNLSLDFSQKPWSATLSKLEKKFVNLEHVFVSFTTVDDLAVFASCKSLRILDAVSCNITDESVIKVLQNCTLLEQIDFSECTKITSLIMKPLSKTNISTIKLNHTKLCQFDLLSKLPIQHLQLKSTNITFKELKSILRCCSNIKILDLSHCQALKEHSEQIAQILTKYCQKLVVFTIDSHFYIGRNILSLNQCQNLLIFNNQTLSDFEVKKYYKQGLSKKILINYSSQENKSISHWRKWKEAL